MLCNLVEAFANTVDSLAIRTVHHHVYFSCTPSHVHLPAFSEALNLNIKAWRCRIGGRVVSVFYLRAGYSPDDYPGQAECAGREAMESCSAVSCPSVAYQLVGAKKIQQDLAAPGPQPVTPSSCPFSGLSLMGLERLAATCNRSCESAVIFHSLLHQLVGVKQAQSSHCDPR